LCINKNKVIKREDVLVPIWGENDYFHGRSLDVFITKIRKYLKDDPGVNIENIHSVGFLLSEK
jgi:DNA-binding response OmpR family regulator